MSRRRKSTYERVLADLAGRARKLRDCDPDLGDCREGKREAMFLDGLGRVLKSLKDDPDDDRRPMREVVDAEWTSTEAEEEAAQEEAEEEAAREEEEEEPAPKR